MCVHAHPHDPPLIVRMLVDLLTDLAMALADHRKQLVRVMGLAMDSNFSW